MHKKDVIVLPNMGVINLDTNVPLPNRGRPKGTTKRVMEARRLGFKIERGIPLPPLGFKAKPVVEKCPFPLILMEVGDSFMVPLPDDDFQKRANDTRNLVHRWMNRLRDDVPKLANAKIATRIVEGGMRVWRVG